MNDRPKERAMNCPNCGDLHWESELHYSSVNSKYKGLINTLYGVCKKCADTHSGISKPFMLEEQKNIQQ